MRIYEEIYNYIENNTDIVHFSELKKLFTVRNLYEEIFSSGVLPEKETLEAEKKLQEFFLAYKYEMIDLKDLTIEMERLIRKLGEKNIKTTCLFHLHTITLKALNKELKDQSLTLQKARRMKDILLSELSDFELLQLKTRLERIERLFSSSFPLGEKDLLSYLDEAIQFFLS